MSRLIESSSRLLREMFDEEAVLFSYSSRKINGQCVNDFSHPGKWRYTINVLAGIQAAQRKHDLGWNTKELVDRFVSRHLAAITNPADKGLLLFVLADARHERQHALFADLEDLIKNRSALQQLNLQEICWMLSGLIKYAQTTQDARGLAVAEKLFRVLDQDYINRDTLLPHFSRAWWRRSFTSFGGITYFLKALVEYARAFNDKYAEIVFKEAVRKIIALQGPQGEWPWFINVNEKSVVDWYPVYSVHQDSMAMLFLLPAIDLGVSEAAGAVVKSYRWLFGDNQLHATMLMRDPFFIYRSIRRKQRFHRGRRFLRAVALSALHQHSRLQPIGRLEINPECRSYQLGWILYAWADRQDFKEFIELTVGERKPATPRLAI